ncbi:hypothetical protein I4U23_016420 [Adineta vaga]|nr:hypothetical protein I4U23_016420 [Adineta vaga]
MASEFFVQVHDTTKQVGNTIKAGINSAANKWNESSTLTKACIVGVPTAIVVPFSMIPALGAVGFTSAGVAAGSIAATLQTASTAAGSLFALCQSAGAISAIALPTSVGVGLAAGTTAGGIAAVVCREKDSKNKNDEKNTN